MSRVEQLYRLQEVDTELDARRHRRQQVESSLGETEALVQARSRLQKAEAAHRQWLTRLHDQELKIAALETKIANSENRLYSGTVKNPKELASLQEELAYLHRRKGTEEESLLEAMINVEEHEAELEDARAHWQAVEAAWTASQAELRREQDELVAHLDELAELRVAREGAVEAADLSTYQELRRRKGGIAVSRLKGNLCTTCHVEVPISWLPQVRQGETLIFCSSCGRILCACP